MEQKVILPMHHVQAMVAAMVPFGFHLATATAFFCMLIGGGILMVMLFKYWDTDELIRTLSVNKDTFRVSYNQQFWNHFSHIFSGIIFTIYIDPIMGPMYLVIYYLLQVKLADFYVKSQDDFIYRY